MSKTILITGGSRGIGRATTEKLCSEGYKVIATSTSGEFEYEHENLTTHKYNQADASSIEEFINWLKQEKLDIDVLVNNAGIMLDWQKDSVDVEILKKTMEVNLYGLITLTEGLLEILTQDGLIINISSALGALGADMGTMTPAYSIAKVGVNMYTKKLHAKVHSKGISVISYEPGWVKTDMGGEQAPRTVDEPAEELYDLITQNPKPKSGLFYNGEGVREW